MENIIAQILGIIIAVITLASVQFKSEKVILLGQVASNLLLAANCFLLGGFSGAWIGLLASVQSLIIYFLDKGDKYKVKNRKITISVIFALFYIAGTVLTYQSWPDIVVCVCSMLFTLTVIQENSNKMRSVMMLNMALWIVYDIAIGAYTTVITHVLILISLITAKLRLDREKQ